MVTIRTGKVALGVCLLLLAACSREQQDWRSAEAADTVEGYDQFVQRHPQSELANQARLRVAQLVEDKDWQTAGSADTADAYREFITQHPNGKWAQEARIRIENFSLGAQPDSGARTGGASGSSRPASERATSTAQPGEAATAAMPPAVQHLASPPRNPPQSSPPPSPASQRPVSAAVSASLSGFGVQLGAFGSEAAANNEWRVLAGRYGPELHGLTPHIAVVETPSGRLYRLQAIVGDEPRARALCDALKRRAQPCVPVLPR